MAERNTKFDEKNENNRKFVRETTNSSLESKSNQLPQALLQSSTYKIDARSSKLSDDFKVNQSIKVSDVILKTRHSEILSSRKMSQGEIQRRQTWLQKSRESDSSGKNQTYIKYEVPFPETYHGLYCTRFSNNGNIMATCFGNGTIQIRNGENGQVVSTLRSGIDSGYPVMCCRFHPTEENALYASTACGNIYFCSINTNELIRFVQESKNEVNTFDINVSGDNIVSGGKDAAVRLYDTKTSRLLTVYKNDVTSTSSSTKFHRMRIFAARFHRAFPQLIVTGGWDNTVRIWDIRVNNGSIKTIQGPHICGDAIDLREANILTGSWVVRGSLQIWDLSSTKLLCTINPTNRPTTLDGEFLYSVQYFSGDPFGDHVLTGGSGIGAVEIISIKKQNVMGRFPVNKAVVTINSYNKRIVFGGMESVIRIAEYN